MPARSCFLRSLFASTFAFLLFVGCSLATALQSDLVLSSPFVLTGYFASAFASAFVRFLWSRIEPWRFLLLRIELTFGFFIGFGLHTLLTAPQNYLVLSLASVAI